jgi:hypothetical protein
VLDFADYQPGYTRPRAIISAVSLRGVGDVIHFRKKARGIATGSYFTVAGVDWESNTLTLMAATVCESDSTPHP